MLDYNKKRKLESEGVKFKYPPKPGYVVPLTDDRMFRIFCRDKNNRRFVARLISLVTHIDYDLLIDRMIIVDATISDDSIVNHFNEQDVVVTIDNTTLNLEMSTNITKNKRKNEKTAFKYAGNQHKIGGDYSDCVFIFYQICIETYDLFKNDFLINEVNMINVTSGKYEVETNEFKKFHVNLKRLSSSCYNSSDEVNRFFKFFTMSSEKELENFCQGDEILMDAYEHLKSLSHDSIPMSWLEEQEFDEYCQRLAIMDAKNEGKEIGLSEGKKIGLSEGAQNKSIEIARKMLEKQSDINFISECTGLSIEEIEKLK